jgi:hypothetical protein
MLKKTILFAALAGFAVVEIPLGGQLAKAQSQPSRQAPGQQTQPGQQAPDRGAPQSTRNVTGTIASIGSSGHSFVLQVSSDNNSKNSNGTDKNTMSFLVDNNTQVQGSVKVGSSVTVEYQTTASGDNVAVSVTAQA